MSVQAGELFRQYRIVAKVGEGGMGVVYRAHDVRLGRDVALKFLPHEPSIDADLRERLVREARTLAALNHPHIVTIHEIGDVDGTPFLVLEWLDGGSLAGERFQQPVAVADFLDLARPIADALAAAHARGIVHRDVKPANVLVGADGRVKLADFGVARFCGMDADVTRTSGLVGTVAYMSPEQARGAEVTPASDVFGFGALAYRLLTGHLPFRGDGPGGVLAAILDGRRESLRARRPDVPADLAAIVECCLAQDPAGRFPSGADLARALSRPLGRAGSSDPAERPSGPARRDQEIRFATTSDGIAIAYSSIGAGPPIVRVLGHFTHLEFEWEWPELRRFWESLAEHYTVIRYDGRGMGLSDRYAGDFTEETRQRDLVAVLDAVGVGQAALLGISEGGWTAATYAVDHPERVSQLVLYGAYCRGAQARPGYDAEEDEALVTLIRKGWGRDTPKFRQVITSQFFRSDADPALIAHFNELQRRSADPDTAARYHAACHRRGDGRDLFRQVRVPTLVLHCRDDLAVSAEEGRLLASIIAGAQLVMLPTGSHYFPAEPEVVLKAVAAIARFIPPAGSPARR